MKCQYKLVLALGLLIAVQLAESKPTQKANGAQALVKPGLQAGAAGKTMLADSKQLAESKKFANCKSSCCKDDCCDDCCKDDCCKDKCCDDCCDDCCDSCCDSCSDDCCC